MNDPQKLRPFVALAYDGEQIVVDKRTILATCEADATLRLGMYFQSEGITITEGLKVEIVPFDG